MRCIARLAHRPFARSPLVEPTLRIGPKLTLVSPPPYRVPYRADFLDLADAQQQAAWHDLLGQAPDATPFHQPAFALAYGSMFNVRAAGVWQDDRLVCGTWLFGKQGRRSAVPPLSTYGGPVCHPAPREADVHRRATALDALLAFLQTQFRALAFELPPTVTDVRPYTWAGFDTRVRYTYRLALGPPDEMKGRMSRVRKRTLADVEATSATGTQLADAVAASYTRQAHRLPVGRTQLAQMAGQWADSFDAWSAGDDVLLSATGGPVGYDLLSGSLHATADGRTPLLWHALRRLAERGVTTYDLCGANTPSIAEYKRTWGAVLTPYYRVTWHRPGLVRLASRFRPLV
jgi:hypothetical protein